MSSKDKSDPLVGLSVLKEFSDFGYFTGTVLGLDANSYRVRFTDGEVETLKRSTVIDLLMPAAPCVFSSVKLSGGSSRVVPKHFLTHRLDLEVWSKMEEAGWRLESPNQKRPKQQNWLILASERAKKPEGSFESVEKAMEFASSLPAWQDALSKVDFSDDSDHDDDDASSQDPEVMKRALRQQRHRLQRAFAPVSLVSLPPSAVSLIYSFSTVEDWGALGIVSTAWARWLKHQWRVERSFPVNKPLRDASAALQRLRDDQKGQLSPSALLEAIQCFPSMQHFTAAACVDRFGWRLMPPHEAPPPSASSPVKERPPAPQPRPGTPDLRDQAVAAAAAAYSRPARSPRNAANSPPQPTARERPDPSDQLQKNTCSKHECCSFLPILASAWASDSAQDTGVLASSSALPPHHLCAQCRERAFEARYSELLSTEEFMDAVCGLQWLQFLELDASRLTDQRASLLAAPTSCPALQTLKLHNCSSITDATPLLLVKAPFATSLRHLTLSGCPNELGQGLSALCNKARGISTLDLSKCSALSFIALQGGRDHLQWTLRSLCLKGCDNLDGDALSLLLAAATAPVRSTNAASIEALPLLTKLDISDCPKLDLDALTALLNHAPCAQNALSTLWCCGLKKSTTTGAEAACSSFSALGSACPLLTSLNLSGSETVTDENVLKLLGACPLMKELLLDGCCNLDGTFIASMYDAICTEVLEGRKNIPSLKLSLPASLQTISAVGCPSIPRQAAEQLRQMCDTIGRPLTLRI